MFGITVALLPLFAATPVPVVHADDSVPIVRADDVESNAYPVRFGAALAVGLPSGAELAPFVRPLSWMQLNAALAHDGAALGLGGGLTVGALDALFTPTLSLSGGHFFQGDMTGGVSKLVGINIARYPSAKNFDFDHLELQGGVLFGSSTVQVFVQGGVSWLHAVLHDFASTLHAVTGDSSLTADDPTLTAWVPSARLGLMVSF